LKSGKNIREFRGHTAYVNQVCPTLDGSRVISGSGDGTVRIWDLKTSECLHVITPKSSKSSLTLPGVNSIMVNPRNHEQFFVCVKSPVIYLVSAIGKVRKNHSSL
jgi:WD40 repeat-containing protein SMU1